MAGKRYSRAKLRRRFPKVLAEVCGHRIRTLRQIILELLGPSLRLSPCNCKGLGEEHFKYCASCDPSTYLLRDDDHAEYWTLLECSYGVVSNTAPRVESFALENRWSQLQIIERATELHFRKATRPLNVICFGYRQPEPNKTETGSASSPYGLECASTNSIMRLLNSQAWTILLSRVGDMFMLHLLLYTSVFYPLPNNSYLQVTGIPISSLISCHQPHESGQSGHSGITHCCSVNPAATGICKTSGFQTESEWSHAKDDCQLKACSHCVEMDRTIPLTESIGFGLNLCNSSRNRTGKNGYERVCRGDKKRPYISDHWTAGYKNVKADGEKGTFKPKRLFVDSYAVCRSGDYCQDSCSTGTTAMDSQHIGHIIAEMNAFYRPVREHSERSSVHLPGSDSHLSNKYQCHFLPTLESDLTYDPLLHPGWEGEEHVMQTCSNLENISLEALQSSSYNVAKNGGQPKKRCRPFRWQRCERYRARKRVCIVKDGTPKDSSSSQQLQSPSDFDSPMGNDRYLKEPGAAIQCVSSKDSVEKLNVARKFSDKILVSDQKFSLESNLQSLNGKEDDGQKVDVLRHVKWNGLSSSKDKHISQAGTQKVDNVLISSRNQTQGPCKNQRCSKFSINTANPVAFEKNANHKQESMLVYNIRKLSCRCLCWLMSHTKHMDGVNTLINRRSLFYNSRHLHRAGFPKNYILNVIKPSNAGAKELFTLIFGLQDPSLCNTCSCHEDLIGGAKVFESLSKVSPLLSLLKALIRNAQHCKFARLLERHSPIQIKHASEAFSMPSSKITNSLFSEDYETQDKDAWSTLHRTAQKDNNHIDVDLTSTSQVLPGYNSQYAENNCLINCNELNECSLLQHTDNLGCQNFGLADCFDEETHVKESFPKHSHVHKLTGKRMSNDYFMPGMNGNTKGQDSEHPNKPSGGCKTPLKDLENELIRSYTSHNEVVSFIWAVCRRIIPEALLGSKCNWRALRSNIAKFVKLRRFENITLQQCLYKLKTSHYPWLNGTLCLSCEHCVCLNSPKDGDKYWSYPYCLENEGSTYHHSTDKNTGGKHSYKALLQQRMLANWIFWLFSNLIVPLVQAHFYVTESENGRQNVFYYRKNSWAKILKGVVKNLNRTNYRRVSAMSLANTLQRRSLGFSRVRFLPKATGVRPIANLGAPSTMWLRLEKNPVQTAKTRNRNRLTNDLLILDRKDKTKFPKQKDYIGRNTQAYVDNLPNKYDLVAKKGDKFAGFPFHSPISDKLKKERRNLSGSDSQVKLSFRSTNSRLYDSHQCLKLEQEDFPEALGCSVFDYNDIYQKFIPFVLGLKDYFIGLPKLYIAVCDVAKAFDTINHDKLLEVIQNILQKEEYMVQRYTLISCTTKSVRVSHERWCPVPRKGIGFVNILGSLSAKHSQCIFIDQAFHTRIKREELLALITEHVKRNILRIGPHFYIQKVGITQGSVLSSLLCSFYFGHLDRNRILPLLGHSEKKHIIDFPEKTFTNCRLNGNLSSSRVLSQSCLGGDVGTCFFEEKDTISGISTRHSQSMRIAKETLDIGLTGCSRDILEYCSCNNVNENEIRHSQSVSPKSILLRLIDDSLFISTSKKEAFSFIAAMHKGFEDYNCYTNEQKTSLNFDMELEGRNLAKNIYETEDGSCFMQWSGLLINCHTLEIQADYTRYCGTHISSTVTVSRQKNPGYHMMVKLCQFMRPKCHPIFYDSNINSPTTVRLNAYQAFLLCAMKFHVYVCSMPSVGACSPRYAFQAIMKTTRYMYKLVKQRMHSIGLKSSSRPIFSLQQKEMEWLGFSAYHKVLWRKQSRYRPLLYFLETKLCSPEYQDLVASLDLQFAVDDCRSSMFWKIQY